MNQVSRTVLITGAAGNLGRAVAQAFAANGAQLALVDVRRDALVQSYGQEREGHLYLAADLLEQGQVQSAVDAAVERFGHIDVLCNLTGGFRMGEAVHATQGSTWGFLLDINVGTMLNTCRVVVPHMLRRGAGKVVNVGAFAAQRGVAQMGAYCAAKDSVLRLTEAMAAELREQGINVNCVLPTIIDTPENRAAMPQADPMRWVSPQDLAQVIVFLASDAARAVHGAAVPVSGLS